MQLPDLVPKGPVLRPCHQVLPHLLYRHPHAPVLQLRDLPRLHGQRLLLALSCFFQLLDAAGAEGAVGAVVCGLILMAEEFALDDHEVLVVDDVCGCGLDGVDECGEAVEA